MSLKDASKLFNGRKGRLEVITTVQPDPSAQAEQPVPKSAESAAPALPAGTANEVDLPEATPRKVRSDKGTTRKPQPAAAPVQPAAVPPTAPATNLAKRRRG